jgi:hypothetical protein
LRGHYQFDDGVDGLIHHERCGQYVHVADETRAFVSDFQPAAFSESWLDLVLNWYRNDQLALLER